MSKQPEYIKAIPTSTEPFYRELMHEMCNKVYLKNGRHRGDGGFVSLLVNNYVRGKHCTFCQKSF